MVFWRQQTLHTRSPNRRPLMLVKHFFYFGKCSIDFFFFFAATAAHTAVGVLLVVVVACNKLCLNCKITTDWPNAILIERRTCICISSCLSCHMPCAMSISYWVLNEYAPPRPVYEFCIASGRWFDFLPLKFAQTVTVNITSVSVDILPYANICERHHRHRSVYGTHSTLTRESHQSVWMQINS